MTKTDKHTSGVIGIIDRARKVNPEIGSYIEHFYNDEFRFVVKLSNGRMKFGDEYAHDQETMPASISDETINQIAKSFENNSPKKSPSISEAKDNKTKKSFWRTLFEFLGLE